MGASSSGRAWGKDPRQVELVLRESAEIVRIGPGGLIISRTRHGLVCANAGVDLSNVGAATRRRCCRSTRTHRRAASATASDAGPRRAPAVIVSDSFGRPWRNGIVNVAIGVGRDGGPAGPAGHARRRGPRDEGDSHRRRRRARLGGRPGRRQGRATAGGGGARLRLAPPADGALGDLVMEPERDLFP